MHLSNAEVSTAEVSFASASPEPAQEDPLTRSPSFGKQFLERLAALFAQRKDAGTVFLTQKRRQYP